MYVYITEGTVVSEVWSYLWPVHLVMMQFGYCLSNINVVGKLLLNGFDSEVSLAVFAHSLPFR